MITPDTVLLKNPDQAVCSFATPFDSLIMSVNREVISIFAGTFLLTALLRRIWRSSCLALSGGVALEKLRVSSTSTHPGSPVWYSTISKTVGSIMDSISVISPVTDDATFVRSFSTSVTPTSLSSASKAVLAEAVSSGFGFSS